ncbi:uncharacterized protein N0V89_009510 [Didymosphaeria variabile]|uniref:Regulatory protein SIR2 homolog 7 n=1 Tax=Didymosphaeria variabile TaxID=1932322 RepID=A0A9W8XDI0_9PLEO|nr:uncharacterized protein N0V89_009510 [Didymosphaeria variabile]KAJ4348138.1 hypothetical protein N0V89_009510 [Didymosphaeria variabile]
MDLTAPAVAETEHFDSSARVEEVASQLASLIRQAEHFIVYSGAGVSTSAGIPDFRGPEGAWTKRAQGKELEFDGNKTLTAVPTATHMALVALQERGMLKCILPDFRAVSTYEKSYSDHRTGRKCAVPGCNGALHDTIINFGEQLPKAAMARATTHAKKADLCLVLGSSCRVTPANSIPEYVGSSKKARLAICNLQDTPLEDVADKKLRIHTKTDDLMSLVMDKLGILIPPFILRRRVIISMTSQQSDRHQLIVTGVDVDDTPASFLRSVKVEGSRRGVRTEPFVLGIREELDVGAAVKIELEFMGHYGEPNVIVAHEYPGQGGGSSAYGLGYDVWTKGWEVSQL